MRTRRFQRLAWMGAGVSLGLAIGLALAVGIWLGMRNGSAATGLPLADLQLRAAAAHGNETFAIATGPMDNNVDGIFLLDYLTGDLTCFVLHPRVGKFTIAFKTNVVKDLPQEQGKKPAYALATGRVSVLGTSSNLRPAASAVYVADCNTGRFAAYTMPWNEGVIRNTTNLIAAPMTLQDAGKARDLKLRD
ncbi:MAG TPA: hypothetical protein VMP01_22045 [Pirellulaceae bacterium]|nr:hypothetical protein [Pirellulaceae bacterium]